MGADQQMALPPWWERFLWGAFGSLLPQVFTMYRIVTEQPKASLPDFSLLYIAIWFIVAAAAGGFTVAYKPNGALQALYIGAASPTLFSAGVATFVP